MIRAAGCSFVPTRIIVPHDKRTVIAEPQTCPLAHEIAMVASPTGQASEQFEIDGASLTVALSVVGSL